MCKKSKKDKHVKNKLKDERKRNRKKIKNAFKGHKGTMSWSEIQEILED